MSIFVLAGLAAIVFFYRVLRRTLTRNELLLMGFFLLNTVMILLQLRFSEGGFVYDIRYNAPFYPLLYGWCAYPFVIACRRWKILIWPCLALVVALIAMTDSSVKPDRRTRKAGLEMFTWAANVIKADWDGPRYRKNARAYCRFYRPSTRPSVAAPPSVGYFAGGHQNLGVPHWWEKLPADWWEIPEYVFLTSAQMKDPSYIMISNVCKESGVYTLLATKNFGAIECYIYRFKRELANGND